MTDLEKQELLKQQNLADPSFGDGSLLTRPADNAAAPSSDAASADFMNFLNNPTNTPAPAGQDLNDQSMPGIGEGSLLLRPDDTSIQGASDKFMQYLQDPTQSLKNPNADNSADVLDDLDDDGSPTTTSIDPVTGAVVSSKKGSKGGGAKYSGAPKPSNYQDTILAQLKAARDANASGIEAARQKDRLTDLNNTIMKAGSTIGEGIANQSGQTKIKLDPTQTTPNEVAFADKANKDKINALMEQYGIMKNKDDTNYARDTHAKDFAATLNLKQEMLDLKRAALFNENKQKNNEGQKKLDQEFAKDYNEYTSKGRTNALNNISKLEGIRDQLLKEGTGPFAAGGGRSTVLPDSVRDTDSIQWRDDARNAANSTLKELFGARISDQERVAASKEYYNDRLPNDRNAAILDRKINELKGTLSDKDSKAEYFKNKATLAGYQPAPIDMGAPAKQRASDTKTVTGKQYSPSRNQTRVTYSDGSTDILDGQQ